MSYFAYHNLDKRPIIFSDRKVAFVCKVCGRRGNGPPNAVVHPGNCRAEWTRRNTIKAAERERQRKETARAQQADRGEV